MDMALHQFQLVQMMVAWKVPFIQRLYQCFGRRSCRNILTLP